MTMTTTTKHFVSHDNKQWHKLERTTRSSSCRFFHSFFFYCRLLKIKLSHTNQSTDNRISLGLSVSVTALDVSNKQTITITVHSSKPQKSALIFRRWFEIEWLEREEKKSVESCCEFCSPNNAIVLPSFVSLCVSFDLDTFGLTASVHWKGPKEKNQASNHSNSICWGLLKQN